MAWKVLVTARAFWTNGPGANDYLVENGCQVIPSEKVGPLTESELIPQLQDCDAVIASSDEYTAQVFTECPNLKVVSRWGVGIDSVDLNAATAAGILATNTPGAMAEAVADYTFGLLLAAARRIVEGATHMREGGWGEFPGVLVYGKTIGLVGAGTIGQAVARRAVGFGMKILAFDPPLVQKGAPEVLSHIDFVELEDLLSKSDFVCLHAPSLPSTHGMFDAAKFARMKQTAYFINTARGALVNEPDLINALETNQIAGAAIDVYTQEPLPPDHPLRKAPRCVLTPHNASLAVEAAETMSRMAAENVLSAMRGERPAYLCNPAVWDSPTKRLK